MSAIGEGSGDVLVEVAGKQFTFSFQHGRVHGIDFTRCQIYEIVGVCKSGEQAGAISIIKAIGVVYRHINDAPNRVLARKFSLAKALADLGLDADGRKAFWDVWLQVGRVKGYKRNSED